MALIALQHQAGAAPRSVAGTPSFEMEGGPGYPGQDGRSGVAAWRRAVPASGATGMHLARPLYSLSLARVVTPSVCRSCEKGLCAQS